MEDRLELATWDAPRKPLRRAQADESSDGDVSHVERNTGQSPSSQLKKEQAHLPRLKGDETITRGLPRRVKVGHEHAESSPAMTMVDWKRLEKLFLSAGGPEALAFKMARDAMLSPSYATEFRNLDNLETEKIFDLPTADPSLDDIRDSHDSEGQFAIKNAACTMRTMIDYFHHAASGEFCDVDGTRDKSKKRLYAEGILAGVVHGRTHLVAVPPHDFKGSTIYLKDPGCEIQMIAGAGNVRFHEKSIATDETFLTITGAACPSLKRALTTFKR